MVEVQLKNGKSTIENFELKVQGLYLSGVCRCGKRFNVFVEMPKFGEAVDEAGNRFELGLAEHVIALCPRCGRLLNIGNGSRRKSRRLPHHG